MRANDKGLRQSYLSMLEILCETFDFELYDYQKAILLERFIFERQIADREKDILEMGGINENREHC